jgi:hypothetical protein
MIAIDGVVERRFLLVPLEAFTAEVLVAAESGAKGHDPGHSRLLPVAAITAD